MKKFLTSVFVLSMVLFSMNVFNSCKDYDEDEYNDLLVKLQDKNATINVWITNEFNNLTRVYQQLLQDQRDCQTKCKAAQDALNARVDSLNNALANQFGLKADQSALEDSIQNVRAALKDSIVNLTNKIANLQAADKKLQQNIDTVSANLRQIISTLSNTVDQHDADIAWILDQLKTDNGGVDIKTLNSTVNTILTNLNNGTYGTGGAAKADSVNNRVDSLLSVINTLNNTVTTLQNSLPDLSKYYDKDHIDSLVSQINTKFTTLDNKVATVASDAQEALERAKNDSVWIKALEKVVDSVKTAVATNAANIATNASNIAKLDSLVNQFNNDLTARIDSLAEVTTALDGAIKTAEQNRKDADKLLQDQIDALVLVLATNNDKVSDLSDNIDDLSDSIAAHRVEIDLLKDLVNTNTTDISDLKDSIDAHREVLNSLLPVKDLLNTRIDSVIDAFKAADQLLQDSIDVVAQNVKANAEKIKELDEKIDDITDRLDAIENEIAEMKNAFAKQITSIIPQQFINPVFGTFSVPVGVSSKVLVAYYGKSLSSVEFPSYLPAAYVKNSQKLTEADWNMINFPLSELFTADAGEALFNDEDGNAGTMYLTVNPGEVDFTGTQFTLVNSKDEECAIKLSDLQKEDDYLIQFGYTRAEGDGFYKASARLAKGDINKVDKIDIENKGALKDSFKEILNKHSLSSVVEFGSLLYKDFNGILPAQALKAEWTDTITHSIRSEFGIAATAIKPLSFSFLENLNVQTVPGYERAIALVDRVANQVQARLPKQAFTVLAGDIANLSIKHIELAELDEATRAKFNITYNDYITISGMSVNLNINPEVEVPIEFTANAEVDLAGMNITFPAIVVETKVETKDEGSATLVVPVEGMEGKYVTIPLGNIAVKGSTPNPTAITITSGKQAISVPIKENVKATVKINEVLDLGEQTIKINNLHVDMTDAVDDLWSQVANQIGGVNKMIDGLDKIMDDVNDLIAKVNDALDDGNGYVAKASDKIKSYIDRLNNKLASVINSANERIQPVLLMDNAGTVKKVSRSKGVPTILKNGKVTFLPTSYTAEIVAPAFKKHVAVTNVFKGNKSAQDNDYDCQKALENANKYLNKVLSGTTREIEVTFDNGGFTYEIAYSALDYSGKISMHKYYVRF